MIDLTDLFCGVVSYNRFIQLMPRILVPLLAYLNSQKGQVLQETHLEMIGELIREARLASGLTQEKLAELIHTKRSAISRLERHSKDVKLSTLFMVSKVLGKELNITLK